MVRIKELKLSGSNLLVYQQKKITSATFRPKIPQFSQMWGFTAFPFFYMRSKWISSGLCHVMFIVFILFFICLFFLTKQASHKLFSLFSQILLAKRLIEKSTNKLIMESVTSCNPDLKKKKDNLTSCLHPEEKGTVVINLLSVCPQLVHKLNKTHTIFPSNLWSHEGFQTNCRLEARRLRLYTRRRLFTDARNAPVFSL